MAERRHTNQDYRDRPGFWLKMVDDNGHPLPKEFRAIYKRRFLKLIVLTGYKLKEKQEIAVYAIHSLIMAHNRGGCVIDSRRTSQAGVRNRLAVWKAICDANLATVALGSESSRHATRYRATKRLMDLHKRWELEELVDVKLRRASKMDRPTAHGLVRVNSERVNLDRQPGDKPGQVRKSKSKPIPFRHLCSEEFLKHVEWKEDQIESFNRNNLKHTWLFSVQAGASRAFSSPLNPCVQLIHYGGKFFRGGARFHSWSELSGQNLTKEERKTILIDGEPATELDFSSSQLRLLYHWQGLDPDVTDLYQPGLIFRRAYLEMKEKHRGVLRDFVKEATLRCLNTAAQHHAQTSVRLLLESSEHLNLLKRAMAIEGKKFDVKSLVTRIEEVHPALKKWLFTKNIGILITSESNVMFKIMQAFMAAKKPLLPIHDAVVCKLSDRKFARRTMIEAYQYVHSTEFKPRIKTEF